MPNNSASWAKPPVPIYGSCQPIYKDTPHSPQIFYQRLVYPHQVGSIPDWYEKEKTFLTSCRAVGILCFVDKDNYRVWSYVRDTKDMPIIVYVSSFREVLFLKINNASLPGLTFNLLLSGFHHPMHEEFFMGGFPNVAQLMGSGTPRFLPAPKLKLPVRAPTTSTLYTSSLYMQQKEASKKTVKFARPPKVAPKLNVYPVLRRSERVAAKK